MSLTHPASWLNTAVCPLLSLQTSELGIWFCYNTTDYIFRIFFSVLIQSILIFPDHLNPSYCLPLAELQSLHLYQHGLVYGYNKPFTVKIYSTALFLHCGLLWDTALCWLLFEVLRIIKHVKSKVIYWECFLDLTRFPTLSPIYSFLNSETTPHSYAEDVFVSICLSAIGRACSCTHAQKHTGRLNMR